MWIYLQFWSKLERNSQSVLLPTAELQLIEKIMQKPGYTRADLTVCPSFQDWVVLLLGDEPGLLGWASFFLSMIFPASIIPGALDAVRHDENLLLLFFYSRISQFSSSVILPSEELLVICVFCFAFKACPWTDDSKIPCFDIIGITIVTWIVAKMFILCVCVCARL